MKDGIQQWMVRSLIIGLAFWLTDGLLSFTGGIMTTKIWIATKSIALPVISIAVLVMFSKKRSQTSRDCEAIGFLSVLCLWILSPFYMYIMSIFSKHGIMDLKGLGWLLIAFPMTAIMASTYSGGLLGLVIASVGLPTAGILMGRKIMNERGHR